MPLFDSFSKIFASLSPHRPRREDRQRTQTRRLPHDRNRSLVQSREGSSFPSRGDRTTKQQNQFSLLSDDQDEEPPISSPRDTAALPQVC